MSRSQRDKGARRERELVNRHLEMGVHADRVGVAYAPGHDIDLFPFGRDAGAEAMEYEDRPCHIYHLGDWDPSGQDAARHIEETLRELAPSAEIYFERIAVTPDQISDWELPGRPTKKTDTRSKNWSGDSVELDAINPNQLRELVEEVLEVHLPDEELAVLKTAEASERELLKVWVDSLEVRP
jgi:hypothetical protein